MVTDLFLALADPQNPRRHPLLAALLYAYCPAAVRWWLAGADPVIPFDPVWQALKDYSTGRTLKETLAGYGFDGLLGHARKYVRSVDEYRQVHNLPAPETSRLFRGVALELPDRFGSSSAIQNLGGDWRNFFVYVRTWAFLINDWRENARISEKVKVEFRQIILEFTLQGIREPAQWTTWALLAHSGNVTRYLVGLLVNGMQQDALRFFLAQRSNLKDKAWPCLPEIMAFDRLTGEVAPPDPHLTEAQGIRLVEKLVRLADEGPHPPLHALRQPCICRVCAFQAQCHDPDGMFSPILLNTLERSLA